MTKKGSRWISIGWTYNDEVYVKSFQLLLNETQIGSVDKGMSSYNYTKLLPNQEYIGIFFCLLYNYFFII